MDELYYWLQNALSTRRRLEALEETHELITKLKKSAESELAYANQKVDDLKPTLDIKVRQ